MVNSFVIAGLLGGLGGATRSIVGLLKVLASKREIIWSYWILTAVIAAIVGGFTGIIFDFDPRLSLLAGYAGTDVLESIYKSFKVQKVYMPRKA